MKDNADLATVDFVAKPMGRPRKFLDEQESNRTRVKRFREKSDKKILQVSISQESYEKLSKIARVKQQSISLTLEQLLQVLEFVEDLNDIEEARIALQAGLENGFMSWEEVKRENGL